jgi:hypothetical protein
MTAIADISVNDGQATPVSQTYEPARREPGLALFHNRVGGVIAGYPTLSIGSRLPNNGNRNFKATIKTRLPVLETAATAASGFTPGPTVAYSLTSNIDFVIPDRATAAERADLLAISANLLDHATVVALVEDMDPIV